MTDLENANTPQANLDPAPGEKQSSIANRKRLWVVLGIVAAVIVLAVVWRCSSTVEVPGVTGLSQDAATQSLEAAGLRTGRVSEEPTLAVEPGTVVDQSPKAGEQAPKDSAVDLAVASIPVTDVPDVTGNPQSEAEAALAEAGLRTGEVTGSYSADVKAGTVLSQSPEAGAQVPVASAVALELSLGPKKGAVPNVIGLTSTDAVEVIGTAGFTVVETKSTSAEVPAGTVISQSPSAGTVAEEGSRVTITISTGPPATEQPPPTTTEPTPTPPTETPPAETPRPEPEPPAPKPEVVEVPNILGMRVLEAWRTLRKADLGFKIAWGPTSEGFLRVIEQDPAAETEVDPGKVVTMTVGLPEFLFDGVQVQPLPSKPATTTGSEASTTTTP